ncbi:MAG: type II toxin-antitoxin system RelE/ParE family toxin [Phycisphaerales bacterium]|nr:type II toxin-antitoxin system RelE/ParE family toxin [Phycisphaerales bacterium]
MIRRMVIRPAAQDDLDDAGAYIAKDSPATAKRFLVAAERAFQQLSDTPGLGRVRKLRHSRLAGVRSWRIQGFENWLIFYRPVDSSLEVIRVLHGARDLETVLDDSPGPFTAE